MDKESFAILPLVGGTFFLLIYITLYQSKVLYSINCDSCFAGRADIRRVWTSSGSGGTSGSGAFKCLLDKWHVICIYYYI